MSQHLFKKQWGILTLFGALTALLAGALGLGKGFVPLQFFWSPSFERLMQIICASAFCLWVFRRISPKRLSILWLKCIYGILFLPVLIFPLCRCYFKIPYVFCRSCPAPCPWGISRSLFFTSFVLLNIPGKFWCAALCPFGTFQENQSRVSKYHFLLPSWVIISAYISLFLTAGMYLATVSDFSWLVFFDLGHYTVVKGTVLFACLSLLVSFLIPKFWCRYFCPIGTIEKLISSFYSQKKPALKKADCLASNSKKP